MCWQDASRGERLVAWENRAQELLAGWDAWNNIPGVVCCKLLLHSCELLLDARVRSHGCRTCQETSGGECLILVSHRRYRKRLLR